MKKFKQLLFIVVLLFVSVFVVSCFNYDDDDGGGFAISQPIRREIYRVTFVVDGINYRYMDVANNQVFTPPEIPEKENFEIIGWTNLNGILHDFSNPVSRATTFYAKYKPDYVAITNELSKTIISSNVKIYKTAYNTGFLGLGKKDQISSQGSGVIFHDQHGYYYVLTNEHVTKKHNRKYVEFKIVDYKGNQYNAGLSQNGEQADYDLSVLYFKKGNEVLHVIKLAQVNPVINEELISIGQPQGQNNAITFGEVKNYQNVTLTNGFNPTFKVIRHNAPIDSGSSGGAVLNLSFNLIGLNFAGIDDVAFSIPIETIYEFLRKYFYI